MRTRILALGAASAVLVALAGCGTPAPSESGSGELQTIFMANPLPAYPDWATFDTCLLDHADELGIDATTSGPTGLALDNTFTIDGISRAITQGIDAILMVPIAPDQFNPLIEQARDAGIIVGTVNTGDSTTGQNFTLGTDYPAYGANVAENIGKIGGDQKLLIVTNGPGGIGDVIIESLTANLPDNVEIVDTAFDNADAAQTADVVGTALTTHPEITVIWSWEGTAVAGISTAIKEKDLVGKVVGVVNDLTEQSIAGLRDGTIYGASKQNFCGMATQAIDLAIAVSKGEDVPAATDTGTEFVTIENLDAVLAEN